MLLRAAEKELPGDLLGLVYVAQSMAASLLGDNRWIREACQQVIERLPENVHTKVSTWIQLGNIAFYEGYLHENDTRWSRALELSLSNDYAYGILCCPDNLGRTYSHMGEQNHAESFFQRALEYLFEHPSPRWLSATRRDYSDLLRERHQLERAHEMISTSLETGAQWDMPSGYGLGYIHMGRILLARGDLAGAAAMLENAERVSKEHTVYSDLATIVQVFRSQLALENNYSDAASKILQACLVSPICQHYLHSEWVQVAQARVLLRTRYAREALQSLEGFLDVARENGRGRNWREISLLVALALSTLGQERTASERIQTAHEFACSQGFKRIFLDEGEPMQTLLRRFSEKLPHSGLHTYVTGLLLAFGTQTESGRDSLIEPLTGREREILNLVCQSHSNQEIARQLALSVGTVKTHIHNMFGKLGVSGRPQAIARARDLSHWNHYEL